MPEGCEPLTLPDCGIEIMLGIRPAAFLSSYFFPGKGM